MVVGDFGFNKYDVLRKATARLRQYLTQTFEIGEPLLLTNIYKELNDSEGVADCIDVRVNNLTTNRYSSVPLNIYKNLSSDGRALFIPDNCILEIKYPYLDVKGAIK